MIKKSFKLLKYLKLLKFPKIQITLRDEVKILPQTVLTSLKNPKYLKKLTKKILRFFFKVVFPVALPILALFLVKPTLAQLSDYDTRLFTYIESGENVIVGIEKDDEGFGQVFYSFEEGKFIITSSRTSKGYVSSDGEFVVWTEQMEGFWQVFIYNLLTKTTRQLTFTGINVNPQIDKGNIVWEGLRAGEDWQIYLYDGENLGAITTGDYSTRADIEGDYIVYSRQNSEKQWRSEGWSISRGKKVDIAVGEENSHIELSGVSIILGIGCAEKHTFDLTIEDLFVLDLPSL